MNKIMHDELQKQNIPAKKVINYLITITHFYTKNMTIIKGLYL